MRVSCRCNALPCTKVAPVSCLGPSDDSPRSLRTWQAQPDALFFSVFLDERKSERAAHAIACTIQRTLPFPPPLVMLAGYLGKRAAEPFDTHSPMVHNTQSRKIRQAKCRSPDSQAQEICAAGEMTACDLALCSGATQNDTTSGTVLSLCRRPSMTVSA